MQRINPYFSGLLAAVTVALAASFLSDHYAVPAMLMALLLGIAFNFLSDDGSKCLPGIAFSSSTMLRTGVALLGLGITFDQILQTGFETLGLTVAGIVLTIGLGLLLSRLFGRGNRFGLLVGVTVAICGASAAMAISSVLPKSERLERDTLFAVIGATLLSTIAMIVYPIVAHLLGLSDVQAGLFLGATIHDVAQVVGAGYSISAEAGEVATFTKLLRVSFLIPIVIVVSTIYSTRSAAPDKKLPIPFFVLGFIAMMLVGSFELVPEFMVESLLDLSRWLLVIAIAALGMKTSFRSLTAVGSSALITIIILTVFLACFVLLFARSVA